jgi:hypothetical protein
MRAPFFMFWVWGSKATQTLSAMRAIVVSAVSALICSGTLE